MMNVELSNWIPVQREEYVLSVKERKRFSDGERLSALSMVIFLNRSCQSSKSAKASASILEFLKSS